MTGVRTRLLQWLSSVLKPPQHEETPCSFKCSFQNASVFLTSFTFRLYFLLLVDSPWLLLKKKHFVSFFPSFWPIQLSNQRKPETTRINILGCKYLGNVLRFSVRYERVRPSTNHSLKQVPSQANIVVVTGMDAMPVKMADNSVRPYWQPSRSSQRNGQASTCWRMFQIIRSQAFRNSPDFNNTRTYVYRTRIHILNTYK